MDKLDELLRKIENLESRMRHQEDIDAIRTLKCEHALASDDPANIKKRFLAIVTEDVELDYGKTFGCFHGKEKLSELLNETPFLWTFHYMIPKRIDVADDGLTATGIWYLWEPATAPDPSTGKECALWLGGVYEDRYQKNENGRWLISHIKFTTRLMAPYEAGWAKERIVSLSNAWISK